ncbi:MAG: hypothetical protein PWP44_489, partial [Thermacetogenium sp.]|nr:hypothetical protein [Thermacetogenium sp.]
MGEKSLDQQEINLLWQEYKKKKD